MALYSVHLRGSGFQSVAEAAFVRQAFNWKAFFFGPFWLAGHRLWVTLLLWVGAYLLLIASLPTVLSPEAAFPIGLALQILLGLEANRLREAKLAARGYHLVEIVAAPALDQAEATFYHRFEAPDATLDGAPSAQGGTRL
jgi:Protein of unknown function (DUF2628)